MIIPMKKAEIVVLKEDREVLLKSLQRYGEFMIITEDEKQKVTEEAGLLQKTEKSLNLLKKYREKPGFVREIREVDYEDFISKDDRSVEFVHRIEDIDAELKSLEQRIPTLQQSILGLTPWEELDFVPEDVKSLKYTSVHFGWIEKRNQEKLALMAEEIGFELRFFGLTPEYLQATMLATFVDDDKHALDQVKIAGFSEVVLDTQGLLVRDLLSKKDQELKRIHQTIDSLKKELSELAHEAKDIELLSDKIESILELHQVNETQTLQTSYLLGWVRSDRVDRFEQSVKEATDVYDLAIYDPTEEDNPPTVVVNNKFVRPFEAITDMFSIPRKDDMDPNPAMSFWFWLTFGLMMGDVGYGVVMLILFYILLKAKKPKGGSEKLFKLLFYCGITTIFWGIMFGSYFGATWNPVMFSPLDMENPENIQKLLIFSLVFGAVQMLSAIVCAAYKNAREGKIKDIFFDNLPWFLMIVGLGLLFMPGLGTVGGIMAIVGAVIIVLMAGREKKNIFGRLGSGFGSLYGITGYMSDILSYSRLLALVLSTAVISFVMNTMAAMVQGSIIGFVASLLIYAVGHAFNIAMGLLSAYVHDSRLQYIEFFGKFFEGGGYHFQPLSYKLNYVDKINNR